MTVDALNRTTDFAQLRGAEDSSDGRCVPGTRTANSRLIGALFPLGFLVYGVGFALVMSVVGTPDFLANIAQHQTTLALGAFLMLLNTVVDIGKGVMFFPIIENHGKRTALLYLVGMLLEVALMAVGIVSLLLLVPLGQHVVEAGGVGTDWAEMLGAMLVHSNEMAYQVAMMTLAVVNIFLWSLTFRVRLLPRLLSAWGVAGYVILAAGTVAEMFGVPLSLMASIPGGLFELGLGAWLMIKGFNPPPTPKPAPSARPTPNSHPHFICTAGRASAGHRSPISGPKK